MPDSALPAAGAAAQGRPAVAPGLVLDTNAALDWLVFGNAAMLPWAEAITSGRVRWLGCARQREELAHMAAHASLARWAPDLPRLLAAVDTLCRPCPTPTGLPLPRLRCSDPDDQVFIDLALAEGARWLLTHDKALLKLARRASLLGLTIARPGSCLPPPAQPPTRAGTDTASA